MQDSMKKDGFDFAFNPSACESCAGNCCIGESGYVWVGRDEAKEMAKYFDMTLDEFKDKHLRKIRFRHSLKEVIVGDDYVCEFFDIEKKRCMIYDVRPTQCRTFPFWSYFKNNIKEVEEECPGIIRL